MNAKITTHQPTTTNRPLPEGWKWVRLGEVCEKITNGTTAIQNTEKKGFPVTRIETISSGLINEERIGWIELPEQEYHKYALRIGDILFSHINSFERLGNCAIYDGKPSNLIHGMNLLRLQLDNAIAEPFFVLCFLRSEHARNFYCDRARRAIGQASLNTRDLCDLPIPLPPLPEQQRIAAVLREQMDAVERARRATEEQLEAAKALPAAYLRQVFPRQGEPLPEGWRWVKLGEVADFETGKRMKGGALKSGEVISLGGEHIGDFGEINLSVPKFISRQFYDSLKKGKLKNDDIIICKDGAKTGKVAYIKELPDKYLAVNEHIFIIRSKNANLLNHFIFFFVFSEFGQKQVKEAYHGLIGGITNSDISNFLIPLPPLSEQKAIAAVLREQMDAAERLRPALEEQLEAINKLPAAILRKAFNGEL